MKHFILALLLLSHAVFSQNQVDSIDYFMKQYNYQKALDYYQKFMDTSPKQKNTTLPKLTKDELILSYYEFVERRIKEIKKDSFWTKE